MPRAPRWPSSGESPAVDIVEQVATDLPQVRVLVAEPHVDALPPGLDGFDNVELTSAVAAVEAADIVVLLVDHDAFKAFNRSTLTGKVVYDTEASGASQPRPANSSGAGPRPR